MIRLLLLSLLSVGCGADETPNQKTEAQPLPEQVEEAPNKEDVPEEAVVKEEPLKQTVETAETPKEPWYINEEITKEPTCKDGYHVAEDYHEFHVWWKVNKDQDDGFYWGDAQSGYTYEVIDGHWEGRMDLTPEELEGMTICLID